MITSKHIIKLGEEYFTLGKSGRDSFVVYINPTKDDFLEIFQSAKQEKRHNANYVRFIANDKLKVVYTCDAYVSTHEDLAISCKLPPIDRSNPLPWLLKGTASLSSTGNVDTKEVRAIQEMYPNNWKWVDRYFPNCSSKVQEFYSTVKVFLNK